MPTAMLRLAEAQHGAWTRLRMTLVRVLRDHRSNDAATRAVLSTFDALPYSMRPQPSATWLPSEEGIQGANHPYPQEILI